MYDVIIIGSGPAAMAAAITAARLQLRAAVLEEDVPSAAYPDSPLLSWAQLRQAYEAAGRQTELLTAVPQAKILSLDKNVVSFSAETASGLQIYGKTVILAPQPQADGGIGLEFDLLTFKTAAGKIKVDELMAASVPGIFAAGPATTAGAPELLAQAGQGELAALGAKRWVLDKKP
ncbi:MAG TPA: FAD-dependent oxidoreductase [Patescibacteria group bacterium]|nr:FAD-dependent oxidoreductase [Patescibacteria group bacterium]